MKNIKREYIPTNREGHFFKCELYYDLGGINYFTYGTRARGYYVSVCPVERRTTDYGVTMESYTAFSGVADLAVQCDRQSKKNEQRAAELYESRRDELMALPRFAEYRTAAQTIREAV